MNKQNIAVLFGGVSSEHSISRITATNIIKNLDKDRYNVITIGITEDGKMYKYTGDIAKIKGGEWQNTADICPCTISQDRKRGGLITLEKNAYNVENIDCVIPALHGKNGEDGTIQGLFEFANIPFVGCGTLSSAICMDKEMTHIVLDSVKIKTAKYISVKKSEVNENLFDNIYDSLGYPVFVKPANAGSSIGVSKATNRVELIKAIEIAFEHDKKILVEEAIIGKEVECAVLGDNEHPEASLAGEIASCNDFYDFEAKYTLPDSVATIPADIPNDTMQILRETAKRAFTKLECDGLARVDFFVTEDYDIILNEVNTFPGFTDISMYFKMWEKCGTPLPQLLTKLVELALLRKENLATKF